MKVKTIRSKNHIIDDNDLYHVFIAATGFEVRAKFIWDQCSNKERFQKKVVWGFSECKGNKTRIENDTFFKKSGFEFHLLDGDDENATLAYTYDLLNSIESDNLCISIDISSMTRSWYGGFIRALNKGRSKKNIYVRFYYAPAKYCEEELSYNPNRIISPVDGFAAGRLPDKPTMLFLGLGYHKDRAIGLIDYLDPEKVMLFLTDPALDENYKKKIEESNKMLLEQIPDNCIFRYSTFDPVSAFRMLESVCHGVEREHRVVLSCVGPKIFSLYCFILASINPQISVWRISAKADEKAHCADGRVISFDIHWEQINNDVSN